MQKKYQVFVSSTYLDLKEERASAVQCLMDNNCIPVGMGQFPASGMSQKEYIRKLLDDCDCCVLIVAGRYGTIDEESGISYTEWEFDCATSLGIPILCFLVKNIDDLPRKYCEDSVEKAEKLQAFREKIIHSNRLVKWYSNMHSLKAEIATSINHCINTIPMRGWVRGPVASEPDEQLYTKQEISQIVKQEVQRNMDAKPKWSAGTTPPDNMKNGDIFFQI